MATQADTKSCAFVVGDDGLATWSTAHKEAWIGLLETHKRLTRALDAELEAEHGLTLSNVEVLGRLAAAEDRAMRLTALANECGLSLSRISRIIDTLEGRQLVERGSCPDDARAVSAKLTPTGLALVRQAQSSHFSSVQQRFFDHLSDEEIKLLAGIFGRFAPAGAGSCVES